MRFLINQHKVSNIGTLVMVLLYAISLAIYIILRRRNYILDAYDNGLIVVGMTELFLVFIVSWRIFLLAESPSRWKYMESEMIYTYGLGFYTNMDYERIKCIVIAAQNPMPYNRYKYDRNRKKYAMLASFTSEIYGRNIFPYQKLSGDCKFIDGLLCATYLNRSDLEKLLLKTTANVIVTEDMLWDHREELVPVFVNCADRVSVSCRYDNYNGFKHFGFMDYLNLLAR